MFVVLGCVYCLWLTSVYKGSTLRKLAHVNAVNPYLTNGFSHYYHLGESTFIFRGIRSDFQFLNKFLMKILLANRIAPDGMPSSAASHLGLFCLPMSHKRDARHKWVNMLIYRDFFRCKKKWKFHWKNFDIFNIFAQNIDCGYMLEPPQWGGSNKYPQSIFWIKSKKNVYIYPCKPQFYYIKVGYKGVYMTLTCLYNGKLIVCTQQRCPYKPGVPFVGHRQTE